MIFTGQGKRFLLFFLIVYAGSNLIRLPGSEMQAEEMSKPMLRVFPVTKESECDWAIRYFICKKCMKKKLKYAQMIYFHEDGPYRLHGCYHEKKGFIKP